MTSYIQQWMIIVLYKFHPENDDRLYPTMDDYTCKFHPESDDIKHPIMEEKGHIQYWMNRIIQYWMIIDDISLSIESYVIIIQIWMILTYQ